MDDTLFSESRFSDTFEFFLFSDKQKTSLDVLQEATIDDYRNMDGDKALSEPWIRVTRFALLDKIRQKDTGGFKAD